MNEAKTTVIRVLTYTGTREAIEKQMMRDGVKGYHKTDTIEIQSTYLPFGFLLDHMANINVEH